MASNPVNMNEGEFISYLSNHGISDTEKKKNGKGETEIYFPCPFNGCDDDRRARGEELHCSFNLSSCTYHCFKCGEDGNYITLRKFFGDYEEYDAEQRVAQVSFEKKSNAPSLESMVRRFHRDTRGQARGYFNGRGINDNSIDEFMLGIGEFYDCQWFMIPVFDKDGNVAYVKLRRMQKDGLADVLAEALGEKNTLPKYKLYPTGSKTILVGEDQLVKSSSSDVLICEGELDRIITMQEGVKMPVVTGGGAQTFRDEWIDSLKNMRNIYICMDKDDVGEKSAERLAKRISERIPTASIYKISLPFEDDTKKDLTDYFTEKRGTADELFSKYAKFHCGAKPIDPTKFKEMTVEDIADVLDSTIKYDFVSKVITFLAMLLAYTESDQQNIMFNADSSTGKTYICSEVSKYFPSQDVKIYGKTTPSAFYYSQSLQDKDKEGQTFIDLERRILVFTEQPDTQLQENIRALLSHDSKRIPFAITNKGKNGKNVAVEGYLLGFPSTFFCSANMRIDEQEQTRCLILSPESSPEKITAGIDTSIARNSHKSAHDAKIRNDSDRKQLIERVAYIKSLKVDTIDIDNSEYLRARFMENKDALSPRAQREIAHFMSLVKAMALVNAPFRMVNSKIVATDKDVDEAMKLWLPISENMAYGISPQAFNFYKNIILPAYRAKNEGTAQKKGITYDELRLEYYNQTGTYPNMENIRKQYIPALKTAALVDCQKDEDDKRQILIIPLKFFNDGLAE